jgi:hypothetical protein
MATKKKTRNTTRKPPPLPARPSPPPPPPPPDRDGPSDGIARIDLPYGDGERLGTMGRHVEFVLTTSEVRTANRIRQALCDKHVRLKGAQHRPLHSMPDLFRYLIERAGMAMGDS